VVNIDSRSDATLPFFEKLQRDNEVHGALKNLGYTDLLMAITNREDYSAARGLGLGLASNPEIQGAQVISARDYVTPVGGNPVYQTGNNVVIFHDNGKVAADLVQVTALHTVDRDKTGALTVTHFKPGSSGLFEATNSPAVVP
jgi:hypothetical protein